jgi:glucoamylase
MPALFTNSFYELVRKYLYRREMMEGVVSRFVMAVVLALSPMIAEGSFIQADQAKKNKLERNNLDQWIAKQQKISWSRLLSNISRNDTLRGVVVASPSKSDPDYYYHWVRDAALVMDVVGKVHRNTKSDEMKEATHQYLMDYRTLVNRLQQTKTLTGLGEPKYHVDGSSFDGPWGRPQNDGPALRAITFIRFAEGLLDKGYYELVDRLFYSAEIPAETPIKRDLEYVAHHWDEIGFDLWEEVYGYHFYTRMVQYRAMKMGARFAYRMGDDGAAEFYLSQASSIEKALRAHYREDRGHIVESLDAHGNPVDSRTGLDTAILLAFNHTNSFDRAPNLDNPWLQATAIRIEKAFQETYQINQVENGLGTAIGRYPRDVYFGGNPWFLTTLAFAEYHYRLAATYLRQGFAEVNALNQGFFANLAEYESHFRKDHRFAEKLFGNVYIRRDDPAFETLISALMHKGDSFMERVRFHVDANGSMAEQYNRNHGFQLAAPHLTWSYGSFLTASGARNYLHSLLGR